MHPWSLLQGLYVEHLKKKLFLRKYFFEKIPKSTRPYSPTNSSNILHFKVKHYFFKDTVSQKYISESSSDI